MSLLDRIAHSDGDPQRTIMALRLINERQMQALRQCLEHSPARFGAGQAVKITDRHGDETLTADASPQSPLHCHSERP